MSELLRVRLSAGYKGRPDVLKRAELEIGRGEILALVGQSGSGKSTLALAILGLLGMRGGRVEGRVEFEGAELLLLPERRLREIRGRRMALVPQSPIASLNPALKIGTQFKEAWKAHRSADSGRWRSEAIEALELASLAEAPAILDRKPRELSVGIAQRVLIALAILHRPALIIADEPSSALDVITQAEILSLFEDLNRRLGTSILYISHDLLSVASLSHRVAILSGGEVVETGLTEQIFAAPAHPYTARLIDALPRPPNNMRRGLKNRDQAADSNKVHT